MKTETAPTLKILVVEDTPENIVAAMEQLADHELTVVTSFDEARDHFATDVFGDKIREEEFDVVLTDVMLPFANGRNCDAPNGFHKCIRPSLFQRIEGEVGPYGPIIALHALQRGVKKVGILTSGNHHEDQYVFAFDSLHGFTAGDVKVSCSQGYDLKTAKDPDGKDVKNWKALLDRLLS